MGKKIEFIIVKRVPTFKEIKRLRIKHGLTQEQAAGMVYTTLRAWEYYESNGRRMPKAKWELFINKCNVLK